VSESHDEFPSREAVLAQRQNQKRKGGWASEIQSRSEQGRQIKCLTAHDGWRWMPTFDNLPPIVRQRLARSPFNICAECMAIAARQRSAKPSIKIYVETIEAIEREMNQDKRR
jgi:hypothetical protein